LLHINLPEGEKMMTTQDEKNLDLLGTFHYIMGALTALFACIPIIHLVAGIAILVTEGGDAAPRAVGLIFIVLASIIIIGGWVFAVLIAVAGHRLKQRRSYNFCLIIAFLECLIMPIGTVLGIFTIITLTKEQVKDLFDQEGA
jgi:hypothetical protein